jgi:hypothetical protein
VIPVVKPLSERLPAVLGSDGGRELERLLVDPAGLVGVPDVTCRAAWDAVPAAIRKRVLMDDPRLNTSWGISPPGSHSRSAVPAPKGT